MATSDIYHIVGSLTPSRHAAKFIATADQAVVIDVFAAARVTAGDTKGTFTAWINVPDITGDYGIISCGDTAAIEFLTLRITAGKLVVEANLATADKFEHTSTEIVITPHRWYHVAVTQDGTTGALKLYVDGQRVAQTVTLGTDNTVWFAGLDLIDNGSIGAAEEAGAAAQIREFKGAISDVKYWTVDLTDEQIEADFNGKDPASITGTEADLTDHWDFQDDYVNRITPANNGAAGASILLMNEYSQFSSRFAFTAGTPLAADNVTMSIKDAEAQAIIIKAT